MHGKLLDTNTVIAIQSGDQALIELLSTEPTLYISVVVLGELYYGAFNSTYVDKNIQSLEALVEDWVVLLVNEETAKIFGQARSQLKKKGRPIPENDIWIASTALQQSLTVVTRDKHFQHIDGLDIQSW